MVVSFIIFNHTHTLLETYYFHIYSVPHGNLFREGVSMEYFLESQKSDQQALAIYDEHRDMEIVDMTSGGNGSVSNSASMDEDGDLS